MIEPEILFLDEPFSALDYEMTLFMRDQLQRIFMETKTTTVLVSHDLEEAVYLPTISCCCRGIRRASSSSCLTMRRAREPTGPCPNRASSPLRRIA